MSNDTGDSKLPPDQSQRIVKRGSVYILLSVSDDNPVSFATASTRDTDFAKYSDVYIFAESLKLTGNFVSQTSISIACNDITGAGTIATAGKNGGDQESVSTPAKNGTSGGSINFYVQSGSEHVVKGVSFLSAGGKGGDVNLPDSKGGDGGNGGNIVRIFQSNCSTILDAIYKFLARSDVGEAHFDSRVRRGDPVYLAASKLSTAALKFGPGDNVKELIQPLSDKLSSIDQGFPCTVRDLIIVIRRLRNALNEQARQQERSFFLPADSYRGGQPGAGKNEIMGTTGKYGDRGSDTYLFLRKYDSTICQATFAFAHPDQCAMLLERAKILYYLGSKQLLLQAEILFKRIILRLGFLEWLKPTDPLYKAYEESQKQNIMPPDSLVKLKSIRDDAIKSHQDLISGYDFNGHKPGWVSRASYQFYKEALDRAISDFAAFEDAYKQYHTAMEKHEQLEESIGLSLNQTSQMVQGINEDIEDLFRQVQLADQSIDVLTEPVEDTHRKLMDAFEPLKDKVKNSFDITVPQLVSAARSFAFAPNLGMLGLEAFNLAYEGVSSVPDLDGKPISKNRIIGKITYGEATVKSIKDTLGDRLDDGEFVLDTTLAPRLMTAEQEMMSFLDDFSKSSFADATQDLKNKFDAYIKAITTRNEKVLQYNVYLRLLVTKFKDRKNYVEQKNKLHGEKIDIAYPDLSAITEYMGDIYKSSRSRVLRLLHYFVGALNFRMLTIHDIFHLGFSDGTAIDKAPLVLTAKVLLSAQSKIEYALKDAVLLWTSNPSRFPPKFDEPEGKRVYLQPDELEKLKTDYQVLVKISPVFRGSKDPITTMFHGSCNIRVYRVRFGFVGLATKDKVERATVSVKLRHSGREVLVGRDNADHIFLHDAIVCQYSFTLLSNGETHVADNGNIAEANVDEVQSSYAAPGPFADDWEVDLHDSVLTDLDFSNVTQAYLDFCGTNYGF